MFSAMYVCHSIYSRGRVTITCLGIPYNGDLPQQAPCPYGNLTIEGPLLAQALAPLPPWGSHHRGIPSPFPRDRPESGQLAFDCNAFLIYVNIATFCITRKLNNAAMDPGLVLVVTDMFVIRINRLRHSK